MGFRGIDTANQRKHYFEAAVGEGLAAAYRAGVVTRADLFLQTKFTSQPGQDERLPYDPAASLSKQVNQSMASSLEHLGTDYVDSYVMHGPFTRYEWTDDDAEVWEAMIRERNAGRTRLLGVSNVSLEQLERMEEAHAEGPAFVQNRCYARLGWDRDVRAFCRDREIIYQGFSLLTANKDVVRPSGGGQNRHARGCHDQSSCVCFCPHGWHAAADRNIQRGTHAGRSGQPGYNAIAGHITRH